MPSNAQKSASARAAHPRMWRLAALAAASLPVLAGGDQVRSSLQVRAAVMTHTRIEVHAPRSLTISPADRARGAVESAAPLQVRAFSNTPHGLELELQAPPGMFRTMHVTGAGIDAHLEGAGGTLAWRWSGKPGFSEPATVELQIAFELDSGTNAGAYDWPLRVSGRALVQ
jgi:hypothetical protein